MPLQYTNTCIHLVQYHCRYSLGAVPLQVGGAVPLQVGGEFAPLHCSLLNNLVSFMTTIVHILYI